MNDSQIAGVCDDQYTLETLEETGDEAVKAYMTRKTQGWFRPSPFRRCHLPRPRRRAARRAEEPEA
jgi:hypothetical protein